MSDSQLFIAHQVNNPHWLKYLTNEKIAIEIDVAYSINKNTWVVAHHDYEKNCHITLEQWLLKLKELSQNPTFSLLKIWIDIKTPNQDLNYLCSIIDKITPPNIAIVYDLGRPKNFIDNNFYQIIRPYLRDIDAIASWIMVDEINLLKDVSCKLAQANIKNTIISYGEIDQINKATLINLCHLNKEAKFFSQVY